MASGAETELDPEDVVRTGKLVGTLLEGSLEGRGLRIGVACARFNGGISIRLLDGCLAGLRDAGVDATDVAIAWAPGAFELPLIAQTLATAEIGYDAVVCLGAVIRGETGHYDVVAGECARGIQQVACDTGVPVIFGVLTCETVGQALERSAPDETNKGREAGQAAVEMARLVTDRRLA
ncbi:MAG TPA: 6,7-dimethyl-8-ribityllumazine synthase [Acidimicrobiales bacterium]|jgi:6,7-dimethyl-8-ribityllumazine synthase